jgi:hypothetical protein
MSSKNPWKGQKAKEKSEKKEKQLFLTPEELAIRYQRTPMEIRMTMIRFGQDYGSFYPICYYTEARRRELEFLTKRNNS